PPRASPARPATRRRIWPSRYRAPPGRIPRDATRFTVLSNGSEIRVQHDAVTGLARFKSGEGIVDLAHRIVLRLRRDLVPGSEIEHRLDHHRRARRRPRDTSLLQDERECRYRYGLQRDTDDMQPAVRGERADQGVPIELHVDGADQEIEVAAEPLYRCRVLGRDGLVRPEAFRFCKFALARGESGHVAAVRSCEL